MREFDTYCWEDVTCERCPQFAGSNVVRATPCREGGILVVGEAPGTDENREQKGFIGEAGQRLRNLLQGAGLGLTKVPSLTFRQSVAGENGTSVINSF